MDCIATCLALKLARPDTDRLHASGVYVGRKMLCLTTRSGERFAARLVQSDDSAPVESKLLVLYSHGNGETLHEEGALRLQSMLATTLGVNVLSYEYPGYGLSTGTPSPRNCIEAIDAAFAYATNGGPAKGPCLGLGPSQVVLFGRSLGSGPTVDLASRQQDLAGLVLQSPLTSAIGTRVSDLCACLLCPCDIFRNLSKISSCGGSYPVLIVHGKNDDVVPFRNGVALAKRLPNQNQATTRWLDERGHNDIPQEQLSQLLTPWFEDLRKASQSDLEAAATAAAAGGGDHEQQPTGESLLLTEEQWLGLKPDRRCTCRRVCCRLECWWDIFWAEFGRVFPFLLPLGVVGICVAAWRLAATSPGCDKLAVPHLVLAIALLVWFLFLPFFCMIMCTDRDKLFEPCSPRGCAGVLLPCLATLFAVVWAIFTSSSVFFSSGAAADQCRFASTSGKVVAVTTAVFGLGTVCGCVCCFIQAIGDYATGSYRGRDKEHMHDVKGVRRRQ